MAVRGFSHVAVGVTDMETSLGFYRDLLGLTVTLDVEEGAFGGPQDAYRRRAVYLRLHPGRLSWPDGGRDPA